MKIYTDVNSLNLPEKPGMSLAIGNFDGVHIGHQKIIQRAVDKGKALGLIPGVLTFKNHPKNVMAGRLVLQSISSQWEKKKFFEKLGLEVCIFADVGKEFFSQTPAEFIAAVLVGKLSVKYISVGPNFRFGRGATGSLIDLRKLATDFQFEVGTEDLVEVDEKVVSSTRIRSLIKNGEFAMANRLLGRSIFHQGTVVKGNQVGREIGYPTANLQLKSVNGIDRGVYQVQVFLDGKKYLGVMNYGRAPTLTDGSAIRVEIHLLDFPDLPLYGREITFQIHSKIREEKSFASLAELVGQIKSDIATLT